MTDVTGYDIVVPLTLQVAVRTTSQGAALQVAEAVADALSEQFQDLERDDVLRLVGDACAVEIPWRFEASINYTPDTRARLIGTYDGDGLFADPA